MNVTDTDSDKTEVGIPPLDDTTQMVGEPAAEATQLAANVDCPVCHTANPPSETYCIDCGFLLTEQPLEVAEMPEVAAVGKLVTSDGAREFALKPGENTVGRENADILLVHNTVSRAHAKVTVEEGHVYVEDLGSTNGTTLDGSAIASGEKTQAKNGSQVAFGNAALTLELPEPEEAEAEEETVEAVEEGPSAEPEEPSDVEAEPEEETPEAQAEELEEAEEAEEPEEAEEAEEPEPEPVAKLVSKDMAHSFPIVEGINTVGRENADILLAHNTVSRTHAKVTVEEGRVYVEDLGSTNGTLVNGVKLDPNVPREIQADDEIVFGQTEFKIEVAQDEMP